MGGVSFLIASRAERMNKRLMAEVRLLAAILLVMVPGLGGTAAPGAASPGMQITLPALAVSVPQGSERVRVQVRPGHTLRLIIHQHFRDSPFSEQFISRALVEMNPEAFVRGNPNRLVAGSTLLLPSAHELALSMLPDAPDLPQASASRTIEAAPEVAEIPKRWIRYP